MSMRILKVGSANARFAQHEQRIIEECEELSGSICEAIESVDIDTKNRWELNGFSTCRVAYVDASAYLPETVAAVALAFRNEGYLVNAMVMEAGSDDPEAAPTMTMLAVLWDPEAPLGICQDLGENTGADVQLPDVTEVLHDTGAPEEFGGDAGAAEGEPSDAEGEEGGSDPTEGPKEAEGGELEGFPQ